MMEQDYADSLDEKSIPDATASLSTFVRFLSDDSFQILDNVIEKDKARRKRLQEKKRFSDGSIKVDRSSSTSSSGQNGSSLKKNDVKTPLSTGIRGNLGSFHLSSTPIASTPQHLPPVQSSLACPSFIKPSVESPAKKPRNESPRKPQYKITVPPPHDPSSHPKDIVADLLDSGMPPYEEAPCRSSHQSSQFSNCDDEDFPSLNSEDDAQYSEITSEFMDTTLVGSNNEMPDGEETTFKTPPESIEVRKGDAQTHTSQEPLPIISLSSSQEENRPDDSVGQFAIVTRSGLKKIEVKSQEKAKEVLGEFGIDEEVKRAQEPHGQFMNAKRQVIRSADPNKGKEIIEKKMKENLD